MRVIIIIWRVSHLDINTEQEVMRVAFSTVQFAGLYIKVMSSFALKRNSY